jgi:hypothetical protein
MELVPVQTGDVALAQLGLNVLIVAGRQEAADHVLL